MRQVPIESQLGTRLPLSAGELGQLSTEASRLLHTGAVSGAQVEAYLELFTAPNPTLRWLRTHSWDELAEYAGRSVVMAGGERAEPRSRRGNASSAPWLRGVVATYLALQVLLAGDWPLR